MKKEIILINGTQERFLTNFSEGKIRDNSAFFILSKDIKESLFFTLQMSIYHAISLEVQDEIIKKSYNSFYEYYAKNKDKIVVICIFRGIGETNYIKFKQLPYYKHKEKKISTYPYIKYKDFKKHIKLELINTFKLTKNNFEKAENNITYPLKDGNDRFFEKKLPYTKTKLSNNKIDLYKYHFVYKKYMDSLTKLLACNLMCML